MPRDTHGAPTVHEPPGPAHERNATLLTVPEVAALLHVPTSWVYDHARHDCASPLPVIRIGKYLRFRMSDLTKYIDSLALGSEAQ
jgi:hypothetical protein